MKENKMTGAEMTEHGQRLFQSAENLRKSAADLDALTGSLADMLEKLDFGEYEFEVDKSKDPDEKVGWCRMAQSFDVDVIKADSDKRKKRAIIGTITLIIRLCDYDSEGSGGTLHPWNKQSSFMVGWHKANAWTSNNDNEYWGIGSFDPSEADKIQPLEHGLWAWRDDDEIDGYFYSLPIFEIRNEIDLKDFVMRPLEKFFTADDPQSVAVKALSKIPVLKPTAA